jgi:hypothetical protein
MTDEEKFKPTAGEDLRGDRREHYQFIEEDWRSNPVVKNNHGYWEEYIAWFEGDQYTKYIKAIGSLKSIEAQVKRETKNVYNRILPLIRQMWGEIRYVHNFYTEPNTTESEDVKAANVSSALIEYTNYLRNFNFKINFAKLWALVTSCVFWKEWWNRNLQGSIQGEKGLVDVQGDIDYNWVNPFNIRLDALAQGREEWRYIIEGKRVPVSSVEDEFGLPRGTLKPDPWEPDSGLFERTEMERPKEETVIRKEYWTIKRPGYEKGIFAVSAGGFLLYHKSNPTPKAQIPYFLLPGALPKLGEQYGDSMVRIAQAGQRRFNKIGSEVDEYVEYYKPKAMIPKNSLNPREKISFTRAGTDFIEYNPGFGTPYWQNPPAFPEIAIRWLTFQEKEIETETSVRESSYGRLPKYSSRASGVLFEGLREQDVKVLFPVIEAQDIELSSAMKLRLEIIQQKYDLPRLVKVLGRDKKRETAYIKGAEIRNNTDVRVQSGVDIISTKLAKREVVMTLIEKGLITDPRKAFELLGIKTVEEYMAEEFVDERQANRYVDIMKRKDIYIAVNPEDNHDIHYRIFNNFRKSEEFETLPKKRKENFERRIAEIKSFQAGKPGPGEAAKASPEATVGAPGPEAVPAVAAPATVAPGPGIELPGGTAGTPGATAPGTAPSPEELARIILEETMRQGGAAV